MTIAEHNEAFLQGLSNPEHEGRARSILDLIELGTFDIELASWLASRAALGESWISGSGPGGSGKTTTMRTLMSFIPSNRKFILALPGEVTSIPDDPHCMMSNELSDHRPPTYLWNQDLRDFCEQKTRGHQLVGNVHADDLEEIHDQFVSQCDVPEEQFRSLNVLLFICLEGGNPEAKRIKDDVTRRVVNRIYYSDGTAPHESMFDPENGLLDNAPRDVELEAEIASFLTEAMNGSDRSLEGLRRGFLNR